MSDIPEIRQAAPGSFSEAWARKRLEQEVVAAFYDLHDAINVLHSEANALQGFLEEHYFAPAW